jgi:hypothetical protein
LSYFAVVYLLKEPLAGVILAGIGLAALLRSRRVEGVTKLFVLIPPAVLFVVYSFLADDLGVRYLLPALPFVYLTAGYGFAALVRRGTAWSRGAAAGLGLWVGVAAAGIYPDNIAYFNELACLPTHAAEIGFDGGTRCGPLWLDEHNVDWGQGLKQLKTWLTANAAGRPVRLAYQGGFPPADYGITAEEIDAEALMTPLRPGLYAVSAHLVARLPLYAMPDGASNPAQWLKDTAPIAIVGHSIYIYEIH